jgi:N-acetylglucosaminyl-diphospho-decaprenol L-rhamnosyltransferase
MDKNSAKLLVIIVTYNAMKWIDRCLLSLFESSHSNEIYIVDNSSSDDTVSHIKNNYPACILIESKVNLGFGKANNLGFEYALENGYDFVYLLNQDAWVYVSTFSELISVHEQQKEFGILSPIHLSNGSEKIDQNFLLCCPGEMLSDIYCIGKLKQVYETDFVMAAHWLISSECLKRVGGFSPSFPHYGEDHNFVHRARFFKYKIGLIPAAKAIHDREFRNESKTLKIRKMYLSSAVKISDVNLNLYVNLIKQPILLALGILKYRSLTCLKDALTLIGRYPLYVKNRNKSKSSAFLNLVK